MNKQEAFDEINRTQDEYIEELISLITNPDYEVMKAINFTSPTGTGKTKMMSKLINRFSDYYFVVTTLSIGQLHLQVREDLESDCDYDNFYVYGSADYKINSKIDANDIIGRIPPNTRCIWLRDEGHIKTNRFDELLKDRCYKVINFSATNEHSDIKCNFTNTMMLRTVNQSCGTPEDAINKLLEVKEIHKDIQGYNPCAIFRCVGNDTKLYNHIKRLCKKHNLKYIDLIDTTPDVTIAELCKDDNEYDIIINKFKITEGINIKRAHILYMDNKPNNNATTIQVIGRCRRNALLYRDDIDILSPQNSELLEKTRECYVFYNVDKMKIDSDENGELQYAFCDHISCQELKPNSTIEVVNGQLNNGLHILELEGQTGTFEIKIDDYTGFNIVSPITRFYDTKKLDNNYVYIGTKLSHRCHLRGKIKIENIAKVPIINYQQVYDYSIGGYKRISCEPYFACSFGKLIERNVPCTITQEAIEAFQIKSKYLLNILAHLNKTFLDTMPHFSLYVTAKYGQEIIITEQWINEFLDSRIKRIEMSGLDIKWNSSFECLTQEIQNTLHNLQQGELDIVHWSGAENWFEPITDYERATITANHPFFFQPCEITVNYYNTFLAKTKKTCQINDRESAIVGVDTMQLLPESNTWVESKSVSSKVGNSTKLYRFISHKYNQELEQAKPQMFTGKNSFDLDTKCNACLGYCVEYYSKYLLYGKEYLGKYIEQAQKESHTNVVNDGIIVRACMLKYKAMMMVSFGSQVAKLIKGISVQKLIQDNYKEFLNIVKELGTCTAEYVKRELYANENPQYVVDPNLSIKHITGLADYITEDTILDVKVKNSIGDKEVRQVLAYHYLSTKRSDLHIKRVIVYDATSGKAVTIDISQENIVQG